MPNKTIKKSTGDSKKPVAAPSRRSPGTFPIVAIGASAGGLEALEQFLKHVPPSSGMAFVVVQHLDPDRIDMLSELLQRVTLMPVRPARNRLRVKPDCVYVIPPNTELSILRGCLYLLEPSAPRGLRLPIDSFFHALADDRREQAIGIVLSGMGSDGTLGLAAIKEQGGLTLVQQPATAKFDSMPKHAIAAGVADIVAAPEDMAPRLIETLHHLRPSGPVTTPASEVETADQKSAFDKVCILLRARTRHDFSLYKKTTVYRRVERRMAIHQLDRIADYVRYLRENPQEVDLLFKELLIGVTSFFRDPATWDYLQAAVLPELLATYPDGAALRAWVAGCSTGEEAYSLAIAFRETLARLELPARYSLQVFATDLDADAIEKARRGVYPATIANDVSVERLKRFFVTEGAGYRVSKEIREMVVFAPHDLIIDPPFTKLDILSCRNLLIYLGPELQKRVFPLFHYSLKPGGVLVLGSAESIGSFSDLFVPLEAKARLFRRSDNLLRARSLEFPTRDFVSLSAPIMDNRPELVTANLQNLANDLLLQNFAPAAILVTASGDLVYISGRTGKYLEPPAGKVNWNIHAMAREGLRQEISLALPKALRSGETIICRNLSIGTNGSTQVVDLTVQPITEPAVLSGMAMLVFADVATPPAKAATAVGKRGSKKGVREAELEQSLIQVHEEMQTLREEMQSSQEELKSANEELQSTNEELQSANEELTTSKEEMQSLNEELQTVNVELQSKVDELSSTNNDMKNLLNSTDIATIFLDNALHVRRFTTQSTRLFKLIPGDVGRSLSDIVTDLDYPELPATAEEVLRTLVYSDREVVTRDGRWFQVKIMPYRTLENVIDGVVITFNDISRAKQLELELRRIGRPGKD
ncbi:chemotaxis protein CheB [Dechloromonas sp. HYN0024]|uniref:chemotaxis protein CheB n=1 Tax=Dechloromonas sp. HYN0024 TaxID=2231055 RepID=UPI000E4319D1|nr:chemotaxis protein CheB [Dechloromonas sp. HYN0024]AXS80642.1 chemotaxis protein CheB [Dechloromonas sp. HYN0024]